MVKLKYNITWPTPKNRINAIYDMMVDLFLAACGPGALKEIVERHKGRIEEIKDKKQ